MSVFFKTQHTRDSCLCKMYTHISYFILFYVSRILTSSKEPEPQVRGKVSEKNMTSVLILVDG